VPGEDGFDRKFRERLQPGENCKRESLRYEKLRGFSTPGDEHGSEQDAGCRPESGQRAEESNRLDGKKQREGEGKAGSIGAKGRQTANRPLRQTGSPILRLAENEKRGNAFQIAVTFRGSRYGNDHRGFPGGNGPQGK